jgi:pyruvate/2-oxoglutarate dehydrogenase complex dihydrolipoamide dehydrogenase (E3) component
MSGALQPDLAVDAAIIGTGQAAPALAVALATRGEQVALFEGGELGGSCVNVGCTPTKTLRASARMAHMARRAADFGVRVGEVTVDFAAVMERAAAVVAASQQGLRGWITKTAGVTLIPQWAELDGRDGDRFVVRAGGTRVLARRVYLNPGTRPLVPEVPGLADIAYLTNETVLQLRELPRHLVIVGGSYIGLELGQIFRRLGSEVTILEGGPAIAAREDPDVIERLTAMLQGEGIDILAGHVVQRVATDESGADGRGILVTTLDRASAIVREVRGSHLLVATGRRPNSERLGLASVGVQVDARGYIPTDGGLATDVAGIWALGDINGRGAFTHTSYQDHEIVLANHEGGARSADGRIATYALYTDPPLGRVGIGDVEARRLQATGRRFLVAQHEMKFVSRAKEEGETTGVIKVVVDAETRRFVGATLFGIRGDEVVQVIGAMMAAGATYDVLKEALPIHPTVTEFFPTILGKLQPLQ